MRKATPIWKVVLAIFSLLLTVLVWQRGLEESFDRPSVTPTLSLNQHEMALLASPALPESVRPSLVGIDPEGALKKVLLDIPMEKLDDRQKLLLAALESSKQKRNMILKGTFNKESYRKLKNILLDNLDKQSDSFKELNSIKNQGIDKLLYRASCLQIGRAQSFCIDNKVSNSMALKLLSIQLFPAFASLIGIGLLIRNGWLFIRKTNTLWPNSAYLPFSLIDMVLLVAGGFVILGEVITPIFIIPLSDVLTSAISSPVKESVKVFLGYGGMAIPSLVILRRQLNRLQTIERPEGGWFQWGIKPINKSIFQALRALLMTMPIVLLISWIVNRIWGDQGGSNPLLEMVLQGNNFWALFLLFVTTVFMAPLFEELIFRGVLLPALVKENGKTFAVLISGFIFALAHLSVGELAPLFVLGVGLGSLRLSSGKLFPCVMMHSLWNGITFFNLILLGT
tara:strand:+ start:697 stop:2055 length:1359 start_codon:yes stop_codon:yes gene_type:complete